MEIKQLITEALRLPTNAIAYHVSKSLTELYPDRFQAKGAFVAFCLEAYARDGQCSITLK